jgi:hypothetical protein
MKALTTIVKIVLVIMYISLMFTWVNTFIKGHYYVHAGFFSSVVVGTFPIWGGFILYKAIKFLNFLNK